MPLKKALLEREPVIRAAIALGLQPFDCRVTAEDVVVIYADARDESRVKIEFPLTEIGLNAPADFVAAKQLQERVRRCFRDFLDGMISKN